VSIGLSVTNVAVFMAGESEREYGHDAEFTSDDSVKLLHSR
jgi:hypothetical protein